MKTWIIFVKCWDLSNVKVRDFKVKANTKESAEKKAIRIMGNRTFDLLEVREE